MSKRVVDRLAIKCMVTLSEELVKTYAEEFPESIVQVLAKHPKLDHQLKVAKGHICGDTSIEFVKGSNGDSVVVPIKYTGPEYVRFFTHLIDALESYGRTVGTTTAETEFENRGGLASFFYDEFGYVSQLTATLDYPNLASRSSSPRRSATASWCRRSSS